MVTSRKAPIAAPQTVPLPPKIATPPMTTARDRLQLDAAAGAGADGAVAGGVEDAGQAGQRAAEDERGEHAAAYGQAVEHGGVRVGADRVELAAAAGGVAGSSRPATSTTTAMIVSTGMRQDRLGAEREEVVGQVARR